MNQLPFFYQLLSNIYFLHSLMSQLTTLFHYSTSSGAVLLACRSNAPYTEYCSSCVGGCVGWKTRGSAPTIGGKAFVPLRPFLPLYSLFSPLRLNLRS